jgi:hypothetical protein
MSCYQRGKEPACPKGHPGCAGKVRDRGANACQSCVTFERKQAAKDRTDALGIESGFTAKGDAAEVTKITSERVRTLEDLIRVCEIDTETWNIVEWSCKASQQASVPRAVRPYADDKWVRPSTEPVLTQMFHVSAKLRRKTRTELTLKELQVALLADIRTEVKRGRPPRLERKFVDGDWMFEFTPFDLHMGKYTWAEETVTNYDVDIAEDLFNAALDFLLAQAMKLTGGKLARILFVAGNDVSHVDSKRGDTTAGTHMDVDSRYAKVYRRICASHRRAIDIFRAIAPVDVKIVPGNHDELTSFHLGEVLAARYDGIKHVSVDNSARLRKYYEFGTNLLGFTHGDSERVSELPLTMAREQPEAWARCGEREFHIGHLHIKEEWANRQLKPVEQDGYSIKGVRVRRLASLTAHDFWHTKHAYMDRRACDSFVYHRDAGFTSALSFNVDHFTGKARSK